MALTIKKSSLSLKPVEVETPEVPAEGGAGLSPSFDDGPRKRSYTFDALASLVAVVLLIAVLVVQWIEFSQYRRLFPLMVPVMPMATAPAALPAEPPAAAPAAEPAAEPAAAPAPEPAATPAAEPAAVEPEAPAARTADELESAVDA